MNDNRTYSVTVGNPDFKEATFVYLNQACDWAEIRAKQIAKSYPTLSVRVLSQSGLVMREYVAGAIADPVLS